jgi:hypothetical protein
MKHILSILAIVALIASPSFGQLQSVSLDNTSLNQKSSGPKRITPQKNVGVAANNYSHNGTAQGSGKTVAEAQGKALANFNSMPYANKQLGSQTITGQPGFITVIYSYSFTDK